MISLAVRALVSLRLTEEKNIPFIIVRQVIERNCADYGDFVDYALELIDRNATVNFGEQCISNMSKEERCRFIDKAIIKPRGAFLPYILKILKTIDDFSYLCNLVNVASKNNAYDAIVGISARLYEIDQVNSLRFIDENRNRGIKLSTLLLIIGNPKATFPREWTATCLSKWPEQSKHLFEQKKLQYISVGLSLYLTDKRPNSIYHLWRYMPLNKLIKRCVIDGATAVSKHRFRTIARVLFLNGETKICSKEHVAEIYVENFGSDSDPNYFYYCITH